MLLLRSESVRNLRYVVVSFSPLPLTNCFSVVSRFMNQYFLLIACLQLWSLITPVNPASTWGPLIFIFAVSATKEAWDDYHRYLSDKKANEKEVWVVRQGIKTHVLNLFHPFFYFHVCLYLTPCNQAVFFVCWWYCL